MRDEEAHFLQEPHTVFIGPLKDALRELAESIPLTYFGIDCGIAPDGRLLLFEADAAMLVHGTDDPVLFPYKKAAFREIQLAFDQTLAKIAAGTIAPR
jgi:hypothetical protein